MNMRDGTAPGVPASGVPDDALLVDVREPEEWAAGHAPSARHIPLSQLGLRAAENPVHIKNLHATLLHLLGLDPKALSFYHNGLDERLIGPTDDVEVVKGILA